MLVKLKNKNHCALFDLYLKNEKKYYITTKWVFYIYIYNIYNIIYLNKHALIC